MFCKYCGREIDRGSEYCPFCGEKLGDSAPPVIEDNWNNYSDYNDYNSNVAVANKSSKHTIIIIALIAAVLCAAAAVFFLARGGSGDEAATQPTDATAATEAALPENAAVAGATEFNGNYYEVINEGCDWFDANAACEEKGGHLAIITSQEEETFIENLIESDKSDSIYHYWLGATDDEAEGTWTWLDGQVFWQGGPADKGGHSVNGMYNHWLPSQPNNSVKESESGHDYLEIQVTRGNEGPAEYLTWTDITSDGVAYGYEGPDDYNDTQYYGYICEWEGDEL